LPGNAENTDCQSANEREKEIEFSGPKSPFFLLGHEAMFLSPIEKSTHLLVLLKLYLWALDESEQASSKRGGLLLPD
jgi:hypothetical protein